MKGAISILLLSVAFAAGRDLRLPLCLINIREILLSHESCSSFYQCDHGVAYTRNCREGFLFNAQEKRCDFAHNVMCSSRSFKSDAPIIVDVFPEAEVIEVNEVGCPVDGRIEKLIPHENCNQFYQCAHGSLVPHTCGANLLYNPDLWQCDWPEFVECEDRIIPNGEEEKPEPKPEPELESSEDIVHIEDQFPEVPKPDHESSEEIVNVEEQFPEAPVIVCALRGYQDQIFPHENCNQFYLCAVGITEVMDCPSILLYNPETKQCDWPENVDCGDRIIPSDHSEPEVSKPENVSVEEIEEEKHEGSDGSTVTVLDQFPGTAAVEESDEINIAGVFPGSNDGPIEQEETHEGSDGSIVTISDEFLEIAVVEEERDEVIVADVFQIVDEGNQSPAL